MPTQVERKNNTEGLWDLPPLLDNVRGTWSHLGLCSKQEHRSAHSADWALSSPCIWGGGESPATSARYEDAGRIGNDTFASSSLLALSPQWHEFTLFTVGQDPFRGTSYMGPPLHHGHPGQWQPLSFQRGGFYFPIQTKTHTPTPHTMPCLRVSILRNDVITGHFVLSYWCSYIKCPSNSLYM